MGKHIRYESELNEYAVNHDFKKNIINVEDINIYDVEIKGLKSKVKDYIDEVIEEYSLKSSFANDLNFALGLNLKISCFILDTIGEYSEDLHGRLALEF